MRREGMWREKENIQVKQHLHVRRLRNHKRCRCPELSSWSERRWGGGWRVGEVTAEKRKLTARFSINTEGKYAQPC